MKINYKQMVQALNHQIKELKGIINPTEVVDKVNEIPENFNQKGWDTTIEKVESMLELMKQLRAVKGNLLTPQFYRSIYNRALIATGELERAIESRKPSVENVNYEQEYFRLTAEVNDLYVQAAPIIKAAEEKKAAEEAEAKAKADQEAAEIKAKEDQEAAEIKAKEDQEAAEKAAQERKAAKEKA